MLTNLTSLLLYLIINKIQFSIPNCMRPTMKQFYIIMFYKHYSNVYMVNFITQVIAYGMMNLMESPRYDLGCERNHW